MKKYGLRISRYMSWARFFLSSSVPALILEKVRMAFSASPLNILPLLEPPSQQSVAIRELRLDQRGCLTPSQQLAGLFIQPTEGRHIVVVALQDACLAGRGGGRQTAIHPRDLVAVSRRSVS